MITIYSKEGCPKCKVLKLKLDKKGVEYTECVDMQKMVDLGIKALPVMMNEYGQIYKFEEAVKYVNQL